MVLAGVGDIVHGLTTDVRTIKWESDIVAISGGLGLLFAKDHNVTGGTAIQPSSVQVINEKLVEQADAAAMPTVVAPQNLK